MARYGEGYATLNDAAAAALMLLEHQPRVAGQEYMGLLIQDPYNNQFYRTDLQTQGDRTSSSYRGVPDGTIAGVVHNHPVHRAGEKIPGTYFSKPDLQTSAQLDVPSFITAMQAEGIPQQRRSDPRPGDKRAASPREGQQFLAQIPIGLFLQLIARDNPFLSSLAAAQKQNPQLGTPTTERTSGDPNAR